MQRVGIIGDLHLGKTLYGYDLTPHVRRAMYDFLDLCIEARVSSAVCLGDVYDRPTPTVAHRKIVSQWSNEFHRAGIDLYLLAGNHDVSTSAEAPTALESLRVLCCKPGSRVHVVDRPQLADGMLLLPFPSPGIYSTPLSYEEDVQRVFKRGGFRMACAHLGLEGAKVGEQDFPYRGDAYLLPEEVEAMRGPVLLGHIHKPQRVGRVRVVGAAERTSFAERGEERCFALVDKAGVRMVLRTSAIDLVQIEPDVSSWSTGGHPPTTAELIEQHAPRVRGALVKVTPFIDDQAAVDWGWFQEALVAAGALRVVLGPAVTVQRKVRVKRGAAGLAAAKPSTAAALWIKSRVRDKHERKRTWELFKRIQEEVDHGKGDRDVPQ